MHPASFPDCAPPSHPAARRRSPVPCRASAEVGVFVQCRLHASDHFGEAVAIIPVVPCKQAEQLLSQGKAKYEGGDRMGALRLWEEALQQVRGGV